MLYVARLTVLHVIGYCLAQGPHNHRQENVAFNVHKDSFPARHMERMSCEVF